MAENDSKELPVTPEGLSRRQVLFGSAGVGMAALAAKKFLPEFTIDEYTSENLTTGNLQLTCLSTEHKLSDWDIKGGYISDQISKHSSLIPEYFPPEYLYLENDSSLITKFGLSIYKDSNIFYEHTASVAKKEAKNIWVVDPAYNQDFIVFRNALSAPEWTIDASVMLATMDTFKKPKTSPEISRRDLLKKAGATLGVLVATATGLNPVALSEDTLSLALNVTTSPALMVEQDFRRTLAAEGLYRLGKHLDQQTKALLLYPEAHMRVIKQYLRDDQLRNQRMDIYRNFKKLPQFASLFQVRNYTPGTNNWEQNTSIDL